MQYSASDRLPPSVRLADIPRAWPTATSPEELTGLDAPAVETAGDLGSIVTADVASSASMMPGLLMDAEVAFAATALGLLLTVACLTGAVHLVSAAVALPVLLVGVTGLVLLPASPAATFLLCLGAAALLMEVYAAPGMLLHAFGGGVALAGAGLTLHEPGHGASWWLVLPISAVVTAGTWGTARRSWRATRVDPFGTPDRLVGRVATVLDTDGAHGRAVVAGEVWTVRCDSGALSPGHQVRVTGVLEDHLLVRGVADRSWC